MSTYTDRCEREDEEDRLAICKWLAGEAPKPARVYRKGTLVDAGPTRKFRVRFQLTPARQGIRFLSGPVSPLIDRILLAEDADAAALEVERRTGCVAVMVEELS